LFSQLLYSFPHLHYNIQKIMTKNKATIVWRKVFKWHIYHRGPLGVKQPQVWINPLLNFIVCCAFKRYRYWPFQIQHQLRPSEQKQLVFGSSKNTTCFQSWQFQYLWQFTNSTQALICFSINLIPKGPRGVFLQKCSKSAISSSRSPNEFSFTFLHF
jgi:hypothetical protein